jgi:hypothetical protein
VIVIYSSDVCGPGRQVELTWQRAGRPAASLVRRPRRGAQVRLGTTKKMASNVIPITANRNTSVGADALGL